MNPRLSAACAAAALAALAACATPASRTDAYEHFLAHWQGGSEQSLRDAWGAPRSEETVEGGKLLVYVTDHVAAAQDRPTFSIGLGSIGAIGGGHTSVGGGVGLSAPIGTAGAGDSCTTRFLIHAGKIESWTFEGGGCGAAVL